MSSPVSGLLTQLFHFEELRRKMAAALPRAWLQRHGDPGPGPQPGVEVAVDAFRPGVDPSKKSLITQVALRLA